MTEQATGSATEAGTPGEGQQQTTTGGGQAAGTGQEQTTTQQPGQTGTAPEIPENWTQALDEDSRAHLEKKGIKDVASLAKSYMHAERMVGADKIPVPKEGDDQGFKETMQKLGAPANADGYKDVLHLPENSDEEFTGWAMNTFAEAGLTPKQAQAVIDKWGELQQQTQQQFETEREQQEQKAWQELRQEWGAAYDQKLEQAKAAARQFADESTLDELENKIGTASLMRMFANIGARVGEDGHKGEGRTKFAMTPGEAKGAIEDFKGNRQKMAAYMDKKNPGHQAAKAEMTRLQQAAAGYSAERQQ